MIRPARSRGVCQACRRDLQLLFERGFVNGVIPVGRSRDYARRSIRPRVETRTFSSRYRSLASSNNEKSQLRQPQTDYEATSDDASLALQAKAIAQLEKELGKSLEQAIQEDENAAELIERVKKVFLHTYSQSSGAEVEIDTVTELRNEGASPADVAREARQIYGDVLPKGLLEEKEIVQYRRLYGEPTEEVEIQPPDGERVADVVQDTQNQLISAEGEEIGFRPYSQGIDSLSSSGPGTALAQARARDLAHSLGGEVMEEDEYEDMEDDEESSGTERGHSLTSMGKFRTNPRTVFLPQDEFVRPVEKVMSGYSNKHLKEVCERTFGGPGLPDSPLTPRSGRSRKQVPIPLDVNQNTMGEMEANAFITTVMPPTYASIQSVLVETRKRLGPSWITRVLAREGGPRVLDAGAGGAGILAWRDVAQAHWQNLHSSGNSAPPLPASKSVVLTGSDGLRHRAADMLENTTFIPRLPDYVHTRDAPTLEDDRPSQQRKQFDVIIAPHTLFSFREEWMRKQYVQNLWTMLSDDGGVLILIEKGVSRGFEAIAGARETLLDRYIAVPEGHSTHYSRSHDQQADEEGIHKKTTGMIVAPCTNHEKCPMYTAPGLSRGRKDICSFQQRYIRPLFLQRVLGAKDRNHDDVDFSYLSVMKGDDLRLRDITTWNHAADPISAPYHSNLVELGQSHQNLIRESKDGFEGAVPESSEISEPSNSLATNTNQLPTFQQMPRIVYPPLKRRGHVSMDLCTPTGKIERWTIPRSFSKQAYRDARKSQWGDIWALGAKTHIPRNLKLGSPEKDLFGKDGEVIRGKGRGRKERLKIKAMQLLEQREEERMDDLMDQRDMIASLDEELDADPGTPRDTDEAQPRPQEKALNNRARKAARKAARTSSPQSSTDADLTFKPRRQSIPSPSDTFADDLAMDHALSEWQAEFDRVAIVGKGKKGGAYSKFGSSSKAAREQQKGRNKIVRGDVG